MVAATAMVAVAVAAVMVAAVVVVPARVVTAAPATARAARADRVVAPTDKNQRRKALSRSKSLPASGVQYALTPGSDCVELPISVVGSSGCSGGVFSDQEKA
jgi:hypothetical protein